MSSNRLNFDTCQYKQKISESIGPGNYMINTPPISCDSCYPYSPSIRLQRQGASVDTTKPLIDIDSELLNITRPASKCPSRKWIPNNCTDRPASQLTHFRDCTFPAEETRNSNPPCNLRGTGFNRWEWTCMNPQERVEIPFDWNINNRIIVKDNHRPCVPTPVDQTLVLPNYPELPCEKMDTPNYCANFVMPDASSSWKKCSQIPRL